MRIIRRTFPLASRSGTECGINTECGRVRIVCIVCVCSRVYVWVWVWVGARLFLYLCVCVLKVNDNVLSDLFCIMRERTLE